MERQVPEYEYCGRAYSYLCKAAEDPSFAEYREILLAGRTVFRISRPAVELIKTETLSRQENQNRRRLKAAGFPYLKTLEEFDCTQLNDAVSPLFLQELSSCQFVRNRQNVIMIGNPGRGKTHLAIALGLKACTQGTVFCLRTQQLFQRNYVKPRTITIWANWKGHWLKQIC